MSRTSGAAQKTEAGYFAELLVYTTDNRGKVIPGRERQWEADLTPAQFEKLLARYAWVPSIAVSPVDGELPT